MSVAPNTMDISPLGDSAMLSPPASEISLSDVEIKMESADAKEEKKKEEKPVKKRKSWGQELPVPTTNLPPRKRAKTEAEKVQRRVERVIRNRAAAQKSREAKKQQYEKTEQERDELRAQNKELQARNDYLVQLLRSNGISFDNKSPPTPPSSHASPSLTPQSELLDLDTRFSFDGPDSIDMLTATSLLSQFTSAAEGVDPLKTQQPAALLCQLDQPCLQRTLTFFMAILAVYQMAATATSTTHGQPRTTPPPPLRFLRNSSKAKSLLPG